MDNRMVAAQVADEPVASFTVSLISGVLILIGGVMMMGLARFPYFGDMMGSYAWMMGVEYGMTVGYGWAWFYVLSFIGIISGILVLVGAIMLYREPAKAYTWGTLILVFSVLSFFGMGGFMIGALLGVVGGALAITWKRT